MPDPTISLGANNHGMVSVNGQPYQKGTVKASHFNDYERVMITGPENTILIPATLYSDIINEETGVEFASAAALQAFIEEDFFFEGGGSGASEPVTLTGPNWDGSNGEFELTADLDLILTTDNAFSYARFINTGSFALTVNGEAITINNSGDNGGVTGVGFIKCLDGTFDVETSLTLQNIPAPPAPDVTPPEISLVEAIDKNTIEVTFDGVVDGSGTGFSFLANTVPLTISGVAGADGTNKRTYTIDEDMLETDDLDYVVSGSNIEDTAGNSLEDTSGNITNSITGGFDSLAFIERWNGSAGINDTAGAVDSWYGLVHIGGAHIGAYDFQASGSNRPTLQAGIFNGHDGVRFTSAATSFMNGVAISPSLSVPITIWWIGKITSIPGSTKYLQGYSGAAKGIGINASGNIGLYAGGGGFVFGGTALSAGDNVIICAEFTSANNCKLYLSVNGSAAALETLSPSNDAGGNTGFSAPVLGEPSIPGDFDLADYAIEDVVHTLGDITTYSAELAIKYF